MKVEVRKVEDVLIVDLEGALIAGLGDQLLREVLDELFAEGWLKILLNLTQVPRIDSAGIGEVVAGVRLAERFESKVKLLLPGGRVANVLKLSRILPLLDVYETEELALEAFGVEVPLSDDED